MPFQRSHLLNLIFLTIPNFNPIIKEHQNLFIILAFARHLLCAVLALADSVTVATASDGKCADVFFLNPGSCIHREKGTRKRTPSCQFGSVIFLINE